MFGYVTVNKPELKIKDYEKYQASYCGLCNSLKKCHGIKGQLTLNYDMTFLAIFLTALYEPETREEYKRCLIHPLHKHKIRSNSFFEYASDMNIALAYYKFLDDWQDDRSKKGWLGQRLYHKRYKEVKKKYPRQVSAIELSIKKLRECEQAHSSNLDEVSRCFGEMMGEIFVCKKDEWEPHLRKTGFFLGKFIYLLDAYEDLEEDKKSGNYNPFLELSKNPEYEEACRGILTMMMAECAREFEMLPILTDTDILKNILYSGVWTKYEWIRKKKEGKETNHDT